ncbi:MAG: cupin domain-containing protein [FCB group bacterium]|nr:cupin domain-containing protein [FCB group bacterium]
MKKPNIVRAIILLICVLFLFTACCEPKAEGATLTEDMAKGPWVVDIEAITLSNADFLVASWTGDFLQMTLMSIPPGGEIGLEMHSDIDQFIRVEKGEARVVMGKSKDDLSFDKHVKDDWVILIPAGYWHNVINAGNKELKLYSIYGPPEHAFGTRYKTYEEAEEHHHHEH